MIRFARFLLATGVLACTVPAVSAQTAAPPSPLMRHLSRVELGVSGMGSFGKEVSGLVVPPGAPDYQTAPTNGQRETISESPSNTLGALVNLRYTAKPYVGVEFNYTYARYTETFNNLTLAQPESPGQIQTGADEASFGYLVTPPHLVFGLQPFASVGAGTTRFKPTKGGGEAAPTQWRATYYYSVGLQEEFGDSHFGVRGSFRQAFNMAPDFLLNYLTILKHTSSIEPNVGFYLRF